MRQYHLVNFPCLPYHEVFYFPAADSTVGSPQKGALFREAMELIVHCIVLLSSVSCCRSHENLRSALAELRFMRLSLSHIMVSKICIAL